MLYLSQWVEILVISNVLQSRADSLMQQHWQSEM